MELSSLCQRATYQRSPLSEVSAGWGEQLSYLYLWLGVEHAILLADSK